MVGGHVHWLDRFVCGGLRREAERQLLRVARTSFVCIALAILTFVGYRTITANRYDAAQAEIERLRAEMAQRVAERDAMIQRLSRTSRIAHILVTGQRMVGGDERTVDETDLTLIELDDDGSELARQDFTIPGDVLFVDALTVKFGAEDVAQGDLLRGRSLVLLRRIYSENMRPRDGVPIDLPGAIPPGYAIGDIGTFEQRLWMSFWDIATDPELAAAMGVRVAQGEAVYKPVQVGERYELQADAIGGLSLLPLARTAEVTAP